MIEKASPFQYPYLPLSPFVEYLRGQGFVIGVEILQQMQLLIRELDIKQGDDLDLLKTSLCPLFATNKDQQEEFYRAFDKFFIPRPKYIPASSQKHKHPYYGPDGDEPIITSTDIDVGSRAILGIGILFGFLIFVIIGYWLYNLSQENHFELKKPQSAQQQPGPITHDDSPTVEAAPEPPIKPKVSTTPLAHHEPYTLMISPDINYFKMNYAQQFRFPIIFLGLGGLAALGIFYVGSELYRWRRRRMVIKRREELDPASLWPVHTEERIHIQMPEDYATVSGLLQKRLFRSYEGINIPATVIKTAKNGGLLSLEYHQHSRPPEYLLLVDILSVRHLQFDYYNYLFRSFAAQGIRITTFYFEGDPRQCFNAEKKGHISLSYLIYHYGGCRLMILSDGEGLLQAQYEANNSWMGLFRNWRDKALLSPRPVQQWGVKESALSSNWMLLPANLEGLAEMIDAFGKGTIPESLDWMEKQTDRVPLLDGEPDDVIRELERYFASDINPRQMMQWLAACCIYPELHWDLMLFTARQIQSLNNPLSNLERIHKMVALPWFAQGYIPDPYRKAILDMVTNHEMQESMALDIAALMRNNMPDNPASMAYYRRRMFIVSLELTHIKLSDGRKRALLAELQKLQELSGAREYSVLQHLNGSLAARFSTIIPKAVQQSLFRDGILYKGLKTGVRAAIFVVLAAIVFTRLDFGSLYGDEAHMEGESYLIDDFEKDASYNTVWAAINYNDGPVHVNPESNGYVLADNYLDKALHAQKDYAAALINRYTAEYNKGKLLYNFGEPRQAIALWDNAKKQYWPQIEQALRVGNAKSLHQYPDFRNTFETLKKEYAVLYAKAEKERKR